MAHLLAYWKIFWEDMSELDYSRYSRERLQSLQEQRKRIQKMGWGARTRMIQKQIGIGQNLWVVGYSNPAINPNEWRLLLRLCVKDKKRAELDSGYGGYPYRLLSNDFDLFDPERQPNLEPLLRQLEFQSGRIIPPDITGRRIGRLFRQRRPLTEDDNNLLIEWVRNNGLIIIDV